MASITKEMAFDSVPPEAEVEEETEVVETPEVESVAGEATIPIDAFGSIVPKMGDTLKVTAVDTENGTVSVKVSGAVKRGGIEAKAAVMDEMDQAPSGLTA